VIIFALILGLATGRHPDLRRLADEAWDFRGCGGGEEREWGEWPGPENLNDLYTIGLKRPLVSPTSAAPGGEGCRVSDFFDEGENRFRETLRIGELTDP
jgi:hypothetical protein